MPSSFRKKMQSKKIALGVSLLNVVVSLCVLIVLWNIAARGLASLPPVGSALDPLTGIWNSGHNAQLPHTETLHLNGPKLPVTVIFEKQGTPHIQAQTDEDLFWTMGYLQARFRLFQMDLMRRQGRGLLSQIVGPAALKSDQLELTLGLVNTAQAEWDGLSPSSPERVGLLAYTQGVNAGIQHVEQTHTLPAMFHLLGYHPQPWTPIDSLVIEGVMTQTLSFFDTPLLYATLVQSLGEQRTMQWFPVLPPNQQYPYDTGPYSQPKTTLPAVQRQFSALDMESIASVQTLLADLPLNAVRHDSNSNGWAINGSKSATGQALLAGDPHLDLSLPSIWFQVEASSPHYAFNGVTIPGLPVILIGKNNQISWTITNGQTQSTLFYLEKTDSTHPNQYYSNGAWQPIKQTTYSIPVKGGRSISFTVKQTHHGPLLSQDTLPGKPVSVEWMGALPSNEIGAMFQLARSENFDQFRDALRQWQAPALNFVYADGQGNIGLIAPGAYPIIKSGSPWLPLSGTGESDVTGMIPFENLPHVYNPSSHFIVTANQRPVQSDYPYYIGTAHDFDYGYRGNEIYQRLDASDHLTIQDMETLQNSTHDYLATLIVPKLLAVLKSQQLSAQEQQAYTILQSWDNQMQADKVAPTIWWTFWNQYLTETFQPWWSAQHVPVDRDPRLAVSFGLRPLTEDLEHWTLHDPTNAAFTLPTGEKRTASEVMLKAFQNTIPFLTKKLGGTVQQWQWGKLNFREIPSLAHIEALGYGPVPSNGDTWTVNAADSWRSIHGPSWRMIVDWANNYSEGIYPGGTSEDPLSPWYQNGIRPWEQGHYYPMLTGKDVKQDQKEAIWTIQA